jgi:hypothetical protein
MNYSNEEKNTDYNNWQNVFYPHVKSATHALIGGNGLENLRAIDECIFPMTTLQNRSDAIRIRSYSILI